MNKTILSLTAFTILSCLYATEPKIVSAEQTSTVAYSNNAYQICDVQDNISNLFLGNSIYNSSPGNIRQLNSIKIQKPKSNYLTFYFNFNNSLYDYNYSYGEFRLTLINQDGTKLFEFDEQISSIEEFIEIVERDNVIILYNEYELFIQLDTYESSEYLTIGGDELSSIYDNFSLSFGTDELLIDQFMLYDGEISTFRYQAPQVGLGAGSEHIYQDGSSISYKVNYDNRISLDEIKKGITAYDYYDKKELTTNTILDEYSSAVENNKLGTFSVKLNATDSANNVSTISLFLKIEDLTAPILKGNTNIEIHYTDLPSTDYIDLSSYVQGYDNYDGAIALDESLKNHMMKKFTSETINVTLTDSSGNIGGGSIILTITDKIPPVIEGNDVIDVYQYELSSLENVLSRYNIYDEGSGIANKSINSGKYSLTTPGKYEVEIVAKDNTSNISRKAITLNVKDGVGPVFFVNVTSLTLSNESYSSADQVIASLMDNGSILPKRYEKCEYITKAYQANYNKPGKYDTQIVCYAEDGTTDYFLVTLNVSKTKTNIFSRFYKSMINFFENLKKIIVEFIEKVKNFFDK